MNRMLPVLLILALARCGTGPDDTAGTADVQGQVFLASGVPVVNPVVVVNGLGGRTLPIARGDSTGHYAIGLQSTVGSHRCSFIAVDTDSLRIELDTTIVFAPAGLHPLQTVDLHQAP